MPTLLVKNVPEELMKELRKLKAEWGCRTWAELLEKLLRSREFVVIGEKESEGMRRAVEEFLKMREEVTRGWRGSGVLDELRRSRRHEGENHDA